MLSPSDKALLLRQLDGIEATINTHDVSDPMVGDILSSLVDVVRRLLRACPDAVTGSVAATNTVKPRPPASVELAALNDPSFRDHDLPDWAQPDDFDQLQERAKRLEVEVTQLRKQVGAALTTVRDRIRYLRTEGERLALEGGDVCDLSAAAKKVQAMELAWAAEVIQDALDVKAATTTEG